MTPPPKVFQKVLDRLLDYNNTEFKGKLFGVIVQGHITVLSLQICLENAEDLINCLPAELDVCGTLVGGESFDEEAVKKELSSVDITDNPIFLHITPSGNVTLYCYLNDKLQNTKYDVVKEQEILQNFLYVRLRAQLPLSCEFSVDSINEAFQNLRKTVASGSMAFNFKGTKIYLINNESTEGVIGLSTDTAMQELCSEQNPEEGHRKKKQNAEVTLLDFLLFRKVTKDDTNVSPTDHAPLCILDKKQCLNINLMVEIDCLSLLHRNTKISRLYEILVEATTRNLRQIESVLVKDLDSESISQPQVFHFYPQDLGHFITRIYLKGDNEKYLVENRRVLHQQLLLPLTHPLFRRGNSYNFKTSLNSNGPLINPHEGLKPTDNNGKVALVRGKYAYYHYCQNKMDDNGWGCAYRSLQTLASWYKFQGYSNNEIPTFQEIQKCLVDIGDKPNNFVGSRQWIGSSEVGFVLETLLGVSYKILHITSGEEMSTTGPELIHHFETHGSPIMIGGGVLAHTILGVDYNTETGNIKFLILDPHYTNGEDLHIIQSKGWCGWKGLDFWNKTSYYNMCMPQVPIGV